MFFLLALVSEFNCFLRSRCSMEVWCPDDIGRDSWDWVGPPAWERACFNSRVGWRLLTCLKRSLPRLYQCCCCCWLLSLTLWAPTLRGHHDTHQIGQTRMAKNGIGPSRSLPSATGRSRAASCAQQYRQKWPPESSKC